MLKAKIAAIEFMADDVRVAVVKIGGALPRILELKSRRAEYEAEEDRAQAMAEALDAALSDLKTRPVAYVLCANSISSIVRTITIPFRGRRRVAAAVQFELEPYLAFPLEDLLLDYNVVAEFEGETEILAMGMPRGQVEEQLAILAEAGVEAEAVSLDAVGLTRLWQAVQKKKLKGLQAVLHVRESFSNLAIIYNNTLAYFRHLSCSAETIRETPETVAREVQNTIRAFLANWRGEGEIAELHLTGLGLSLEENQAFSQALRLPVDDRILISQLKGGDLALQVGPTGADYNTFEAAVGAALSASGGAYAVDFTKTKRDWQGPARGVATHLMFSSCLALLVLIGWAFYYHRAAALNEQECAGLQQTVQLREETLVDMAQEGLGDQVDVTVFDHPTLLVLLAEIGAKMPEDKVTITDIRIAPPDVKGWWIRIQGAAADSAVFNEVFSALKQSTLFRVDEEPDLSLQDEMTSFVIKAFQVQEDTDESGL